MNTSGVAKFELHQKRVVSNNTQRTEAQARLATFLGQLGRAEQAWGHRTPSTLPSATISRHLPPAQLHGRPSRIP